jgi:hypothetical protein
MPQQSHNFIFASGGGGLCFSLWLSVEIEAMFDAMPSDGDVAHLHRVEDGACSRHVTSFVAYRGHATATSMTLVRATTPTCHVAAPP